ncbi:MAG: hypothetical protein AAGG44_10215 [Planctomycetota bacterium]
MLSSATSTLFGALQGQTAKQVQAAKKLADPNSQDPTTALIELKKSKLDADATIAALKLVKDNEDRLLDIVV